MESRVRKRASIFSRIFLSVLIPELVIFSAVAILGYSHIKKYIAEHENEQIRTIQKEVISLSNILNEHFNMVGDNMAEGMEQVASHIRDLYSQGLLDLEKADLFELLRNLNLDSAKCNLYIIKNGVVINTTLAADQGLDLYKFGAEFKRKLVDAIQRGKFELEPLAIDPKTLLVQRYAYMPTRDKKYLIELNFGSKNAQQVHGMIKARLESLIGENNNVVEVNHIITEMPDGRTVSKNKYLPGDPLFNLYFDSKINQDSTLLSYTMYLGRDTVSAINDTLDAYYAYFPNPSQVLRVIYNNRYGKEAAAAEWKRSALVFGFAMLILLTMVFINSRIIAKPISELLAGAKAVGKGELGTRVALSGTKETAALARQFNFMARNLEKSRDKLTRQKNKIEAQAEQLTEQNAKLIELDQFKESMTSMIVHDLKNPLNTIVNSDTDSNIQEQNKSMRRSGKMMLNMVMDILDVSKYENSKMTLSLGSRSIAMQMERATEQVRFLADRRGITLILDIEHNLSVYADGEVLERIIVNLLTNAIKFSPVKGNLQITGKAVAGGMVRLEVKDEGPGIPEHLIETVFSRFGQAEERKSGDVRSTGLGLAFCKMAVEAHGGEIGVVSTVGEGSAFWFTLRQSDEQGVPLTKQGPDSTEKVGDTLRLTAADCEYLKPFIEQLKDIPIYKVSAFRKVLKTVERKNENIIRWKIELEYAFDAADEERFAQYLKMSAHAK